MDVIDERFAVYTAVLVVCSAVSVLAGFGAGALLFVTVFAALEGTYWCVEALTAPDPVII